MSGNISYMGVKVLNLTLMHLSVLRGCLIMLRDHFIEIEREHTFVSILLCFVDTRVICYDQLALINNVYHSNLQTEKINGHLQDSSTILIS